MGDDQRRFVEAATVDGREPRARTLLAERPELAAAGLDCALVLGDAAAVADALCGDPGLVVRQGGARGGVPLLYPCHSCFAAAHRDGVVAVLEELGAEPDAGPAERLAGAFARLDVEAARALMREPPELDTRIRSAIVDYAVAHGLTGVAALVEVGLGLELRGWEDRRPLHAAAWRGDVLTVDALI